MTRDEIQRELETIEKEITRRKISASVTAPVVAEPPVAVPVAETPAATPAAAEPAVMDEIAHEESIFDEAGFSEIAESAPPVEIPEVQATGKRANRAKRKLFTFKRMALVAAALACAWFFLGQGNDEKQHEAVDHSSTNDAFAPRPVAQGPVPVPVQKPMSSVSVVSVPVVPDQAPPVVKPVEVEPPLKQVTAQKAQVVKPVVAVPKTPVVEQEAPKLHVKRQAAVHHHARPLVVKSVTRKPFVKVAAAQKPVTVEKTSLAQPSEADEILSLKQARDLN